VSVDFQFPSHTDDWLLESSPHNSVVISSRARIARNIPRIPFASRANAHQLQSISDSITRAFSNDPNLSVFKRVNLADLKVGSKCYLRESHLISSEFEKGGTGRVVFLNPDMTASIMVNEEDHLRITSLVSGMRLGDAYEKINRIEEALERQIDFAYTDEFGYLTACPTNTGTGLRLSVMMHLPALAMINQVEDTLSSLRSYGLVVRGAYGEHSENVGDLYQVSNEITLGKSEQELLHFLEKIIHQLIERELETRDHLWDKARYRIEDSICRAVGVMSMARSIDSREAIELLSKTRLGIGQNCGLNVTHSQLSLLFLDIQPAHLQFKNKLDSNPDNRDLERAKLLRSIFRNQCQQDRNN
jgi:protein arginine kinase